MFLMDRMLGVSIQFVYHRTSLHNIVPALENKTHLAQELCGKKVGQ